MNLNSYQEASRVYQYQKETGDNLTIKTAKALGLSSCKSYIHKVRSRLRTFNSFSSTCSPFENPSTDGQKGSPRDTVKVSILKLFNGKDVTEFTTRDIRARITIPRSTLSKAITELIQEGKIKIIDASSQLKRYRWIHNKPQKFVDVFLNAHDIRLQMPDNSYPLLLLPIHINRFLCGIRDSETEISQNVIAFMSRQNTEFSLDSEEVAEHIEPIERLILSVFASNSDYRIYERSLEKELNTNKQIRRILENLDDTDYRKALLFNKCLPKKLEGILTTAEGKKTLYSASVRVLGGDIYRDTGNDILPSIIEAVKKEYSELTYDKQWNAFISILPINRKAILSTLTKSINSCASKVTIPEKKINVKMLYKEVAEDLLKDHGFSSF